MARAYANVTTAIWRDPDFRTLSGAAQRLYLMLLTQPDISSCGLLPITMRRWSGNAADSDQESLSIALRELCDRQYVVADWDREEVLVRTFVKWDGGYKVPKRLQAIIKAAQAIQSTTLMQVAAYELSKLGIDHQLAAEPIDSLSIGNGEPTDTGIDTPGVVVTTKVSTPTHNPQPTTHNPSTGAAAKPIRGTRLPDGWQPSQRLVDWVRAEYPAVNGRVETEKFRDYWHSKAGAGATKTDWDATFRNWIRNAADHPPPRRPTTDDRVRDGLELARRLETREVLA